MVKVTGLIYQELPDSPTIQNGMLVLQVPGLAAGCSTNPYCKDVGYVCFIRQLENNKKEQEVAEWHNKYIR